MSATNCLNHGTALLSEQASGRVGKWQHELACEWWVWWDGLRLTGTQSEWASGLESGWARACKAESECSGQAGVVVRWA